MLFSFLKEEFSTESFLLGAVGDIGDNDTHGSVPEYYMDLIVEGRMLLSTPNFPWEMLGLCANKYFETEVEAREWLTSILEGLEGEIRKIPKRDPCE